MIFIYNIDPITVTTNVVDVNTMTISWTTPPSVINQMVDQYAVVVSSRCLTGNDVTPTQRFSVSTIQPPIVTAQQLRKFHLEYVNTISVINVIYFLLCILNFVGPFTPYQVRVTATICQTPIEIFNQILYTQQGMFCFEDVSLQNEILCMQQLYR